MTMKRSSTRTTDRFHEINRSLYLARYRVPNSYVECLGNIRKAHAEAEAILLEAEWLFPHEEQWLQWVLSMTNKEIFTLDWIHTRPQ